MQFFYVFLAFFSFLKLAQSNINSTSGAINYLSKFGYIDSASELESRRGNFNLEKFLLKFQEFFKLQRTGKLDQDTLRIMNSPRCGVPDLFDTETNEKRRYKRFAVQGSTWKKQHLTWTISKFSKRPNLRNKHKAIIRTLDKAFSLWSSNSRLTFTYTNKSNADIDIKFERLDHRDGSPFDGANNTLAHAFFPQYGGDVHFDDDEDWTLNDDQSGVHLLSVAVHEIGHSLGLSHSSVENSVMYPTYDGARAWLGKDDIEGIQSLYGASNEKQKQSNFKKDNDYEDICDNFDIDSALCYKPHYCIAFKGNMIYKFKPSGSGGIVDGYPKKIDEIFLTMSGPIDAAYKEDDRMFLIKKDMVYEFEKFFTKPIRVFNVKKLIPGWKPRFDSKYIDAIYKKKRTGNIYIFSGDWYWRFNRSKGMSPHYPKPISHFDNLPSGLDAVIDWDEDETLFFKGNEYWVYNEVLNKMKSNDPSNVLADFLKCRN